MHRLTARILLVLLLVTTFVPAAVAISGPSPHACCLRKMHSHTPGGNAFQATMLPGNGNCCPPLAVGLWATPASPMAVHAGIVAENSSFPSSAVRPGNTVAPANFVRGPPTSSIA